MKICLVGLDNLPVLAPGYEQHTVGGEPVQQSLLARALASRGHEVSMVVADYGQDDGAQWDGVTTFKAYRREAGWPVLRFAHPRWTGLWSALGRADADLYYTSCAGMHVGLLAMFCRRFRKHLVFRAASDTDCDRKRLLVRYARDRWLYEKGLRGTDAILVQTTSQAKTMLASYGLGSRVAGMLVEKPQRAVPRDIDILWVSNMRQLKRPDRALEIARQRPDLSIHMAGGPLPGEERLYQDIERAARQLPNLHFHGQLSYREASDLYDRARVFLNTSDIEGFPNSYLQAWIRGVPVVTLIDPDRVIARERLGVAAGSASRIPQAIRGLLENPAEWKAASGRCLAFMEREFDNDRILGPYLETFAEVMRKRTQEDPEQAMATKARHV